MDLFDQYNSLFIYPINYYFPHFIVKYSNYWSINSFTKRYFSIQHKTTWWTQDFQVIPQAIPSPEIQYTSISSARYALLILILIPSETIFFFSRLIIRSFNNSNSHLTESFKSIYNSSHSIKIFPELFYKSTQAAIWSFIYEFKFEEGDEFEFEMDRKQKIRTINICRSITS